MLKKILLLSYLLITSVYYIQAQPMPQTAQHHWHGKRVAYLGDSITDPRVKAGTEKWWTLLSQWLDITPYCYGVSGRQWNDIPRQAKALAKEHPGEIDAILIFMGTNDYFHGVPLGEWYDVTTDSVTVGEHGQVTKQPRRHRHMAMDKETYRGRMNIAMEECKKLFPNTQIVVLTPIHRAFFQSGEKNIQPDESYANRLGLWIDSYVEATKEVANVWAVPVIDLNSLSGLYPVMDEYAHYFTNADRDRLHPGDAGYTRIAQALYYQLMALPCGPF